MSAEHEEHHKISVSFDYTGHDTFEDISRAMASFADAFKAYARDKDAVLRIVDFQPGSLQCNLDANALAWGPWQVMSQDLSELQAGRKTFLMPDVARRSLMRTLEKVASVNVTYDSGSVKVGQTAGALLESVSSQDHRQDVIHAGILDKVDLKADIFRLMLPHGQRVNCYPATPYIATLSRCLQRSVPRLSVRGNGKFRIADFVPGTIQVRSVEIVEKQDGFNATIDRIVGEIDKAAVTDALEAHWARLEADLERFAASQEQSTFD